MAEQPGDTILLSDIAGSPLIIPSRPPLQEEIRGWFHRIEREHTILCTYNTLSCIVPLVERNVAVAICPEAVRYFYRPAEAGMQAPDRAGACVQTFAGAAGIS